MRFVFSSYVVSSGFTHPLAWLHRIRAYAGMLEALAAEHEVISIEQIDFEGEYAQNGVRYIFFRQPAGGNKVPFRLHRKIRALSPDVVVIQGLHFPLQVMQLKFALEKKTRLLVQHHAELPFRGPGKWAQLTADHFIDGYLFASKQMGLNWIKKGNLSSPGKIHEVMEVSSVFYPIDRPFARSKTGASGDPVFLWVGRLNANKDPLTVLRAWLKYSLLCPRARLFLIYGTDESLPEVLELLGRHPGGDSVRLIGNIANGDMGYWYNSADYLLSGSHYEGSGAAVCEALSCGCVPLLTGIDSFRSMTDNGRCGYLWEPGNEASLYDLLTRLCPAMREEKRKLALAFFRDRLSFPAIARQIQEVVTALFPSSVPDGKALPKYESLRAAKLLETSKN